MEHAQAYLNGRFLPAHEAQIAVTDAGFVLGATVSEQLRTFHGRLFRLDDHLARLARGLAFLGGSAAEISLATLANVAQDLVAVNHPLVRQESDLGLAIVVTPGAYAAFAGPTAPASPLASQQNEQRGAASAARRDDGPTVCLHTYELPFHRWAEKYRDGEHLVTTPYQQTPAECWPRELKCRSRMHYYLADRHAAAIAHGARALLLDDEGQVTETSTANVLVYRDGEGLVSPPRESILPGISLATTLELAAAADIAGSYRPLTLEDIATAQEVLTTSTPSCLLPVTRFNSQRIGNGAPGPIYARLLAAWNDLVGLNIEAQAIAMSIAQA